MNLPKLKIVERVKTKYLFKYMVDGTESYCFVRLLKDKIEISIATNKKDVDMTYLIETKSTMGRDINKQILDYEMRNIIDAQVGDPFIDIDND